MSSHTAKISVLTQIRDSKDILFGRFSDKLTHKDKEDKWKEILESAIAMGLFTQGKKWTELRDVSWQNWRKRTVEKKDNKKKTGKGGGRAVQYDEADLIILDIMGVDSPILDGLYIPESSGSDEPTVTAETRPSPENTISNSASISKPKVGGVRANNQAIAISHLGQLIENMEQDINDVPVKPKRSLGKHNSTPFNEIRDLHEKKLQAQIEGIELENKRRKLDIYETERRLNLPLSKSTTAFIDKEYGEFTTYVFEDIADK